MTFKNIDFGKSAAENEPEELLIEGFWDNHGFVNKIINESTYLILGPKGSGKSAIGRKIELLANEEHNFHASRYNLSDFPYKLFSSLFKNKESLEVKYQNDWEYLLLVTLLTNFMDEPNFIKNNPDAKNIIDSFENKGILPSDNLTEIIKSTAQTEVGAKYIVDASRGSQTDKVPFSISMIYESLKKLCYTIDLESKHFIVIDGLDDVLLGSDKQFSLLGALILVVERMNSRFRERAINAKIIVLCRTDLFNKFPGSNNNKIKQDSSIVLDWYQEKDIKSTNLVNLINLRAKVSLGKEVDVFEDMFPKTMTRYKKETLKYLFNYTRHTPRDLIVLLNKIQDATKGEYPNEDEIWTGIDNYSSEYFLNEITDELHGFLTPEEIEKAMQLLSMMRTTNFMESDMLDKVKCMDGYMILDVHKILNQLFECNSIGNIDKNEYMSFKHRNSHLCLMTDEHIIIHKGLWKALNLKVGAYNSYQSK